MDSRYEGLGTMHVLLVPSSSDVTFDTKACVKQQQQQKTLTLKHCKGAWFVLPKARDLCVPENNVTASVSCSKEANHNLYMKPNELCQWNNSLRTETVKIDKSQI